MSDSNWKNAHTLETRFCSENSLNLFKHEKKKSKYYHTSLSLLHPIPRHQSLHTRQQEDKEVSGIPKNHTPYPHPKKEVKEERD